MREIGRKKDRTVSEVIGTMFVFAMFISLLTIVLAWYIPAAQTSAEQNYQSDTLSAMSELTSSLSSTGLKSGSLINQNIPMGISGSFFLPTTQTSLTYSSTGFTGNMHYDLGLAYKYVSSHPTSGVLNKIIGSFPQTVILNASSEVYIPQTASQPARVYVAGYSSNNIAVIDLNTMELTKIIPYAGNNPSAMVYDPIHQMVYVADSYVPSSGHSVVSKIYTSNDTYGGNISLNMQNPDAITYGVFNTVPYVYVSSSKNPYVESINTNTNTLANSITTGGNTKNPAVKHPVIQYYAPGNSLVALDNKTNGNHQDAYMVLPGNLSSFQTYHLGHGNKMLKTGDLTGVAFDGSLMLITVTNATQGNGHKSTSQLSGLIATTYESSVVTFTAQFYGKATGITFNKTLSQLAVSVHTYTNVDAVYSFNVVFPGSGTPLTNQSGSVNITQYATGMAFGNVAGKPYYFVASSVANELTVVSTNGSPVDSISVYRIIHENYFENPISSVYDPLNNYLYVSNNESGTVSVISTFNNELLSKVNLGQTTNPTMMAVNTRTGHVYVVENANYTIAVINNLSLVKQVQLTYASGNNKLATPTDVAYDPYTNSIYIAAYYTSSNGITTGAVYNMTRTTAPVAVTSNANYLYQTLEFDPFTNQTYAVMNEPGQSTFYLVDVSSGAVTQNVFATPSGETGNFTLAFNSYTGNMYAAFSRLGQDGEVLIFSGTSSAELTQAVASIKTGGEPTGPVFDPGNSFIYVPNQAPVNPGGPSSGVFSGSGANVTVINAESNTYLTTMWVGNGPQNACFDPANGYIYIPASLSDKITIIDGGFTIFNGKPGVFVGNSISYGGSISASAQTSFIPEASYVMEGDMLIQNFSSLNYVIFQGALPVSVAHSDNRLYLSAFSVNFEQLYSSTSNSLTSTSSTILQLQVLNKVNNAYYVGSHFYVSDLYGNQYQAVVTDIYLENFTMTYTTSYASALNSFLYESYNGSLVNAPASWDFKDISMPFHVIYNQARGMVSISERFGFTPSMYSVSFLYYNMGLTEL